MCGLAGWHSPLGQRTGLAVCLFIVAFSIVGHDFNRYWGLLIAPLACFGVVRFPASLADLWKAGRWGDGSAWMGFGTGWGLGIRD